MATKNDDHSLTILEAFPEDEGLYKCVVTNPAGHTSTSAYLKIERIYIINKYIFTNIQFSNVLKF
jgi:hypothetical protein